MPSFLIPNSASLHSARSFLAGNDFFGPPNARGRLVFHPRWAHMEPFALAMAASWGAHCRSQGLEIDVEDPGNTSRYAARMGLYGFLDVAAPHVIHEHEATGRFLPLTQVSNALDLQTVISNLSALLHLDGEPETLAAVQYCISELLRNVMEHSESPEGAFVCAHNYTEGSVPRVSFAVADCGIGVQAHLGRRHAEAQLGDIPALRLALSHGVSGAQPGAYGTPDNAGAGLFITRCISKGCGGYFLAVSGTSAYRMRRARNPDDQMRLELDPWSERHDLWVLDTGWPGTVIALEIRTDHILDFANYFSWILEGLPRRESVRAKIKFT